jgi:hypothetical protein
VNELQGFLDQLSLTGPIEPFLVFADWLLGQGDPWGELIAMQCQAAIGSDDPKLRVIELTAYRVLDQIAERLCPHDALVGIAWKRGFVSSIAFSDTRGPEWVGQELARMLSLPACALVEEVSFANGYLGDEDVRGLLRVRERLQTVDRLDFEGNWFTAPTVRALRHAFPKARLDGQRGNDEDRPDRSLFIKSWDERGEE